jgi:hypothetical protein
MKDSPKAARDGSARSVLPLAATEVSEIESIPGRSNRSVKLRRYNFRTSARAARGNTSFDVEFASSGTNEGER